MVGCCAVEITMKHLPVAFLLAVTTLAGAVKEDPKYSLVFQPVAGAKRVYKVITSVKEDNFSSTTVVEQEILELLTEGRYTQRDTTKSSEVSFKGETSQTTDTKPITYLYRPDGVLEQIIDPDPNGPDDQARDEALTNFYPPTSPLKVGESWTKTVPSGPMKGTVELEVTGKVEGLEKVAGLNSVKVQYKVVEKDADPRTFEGTVWLDTTSFAIVKVEAQMKSKDEPNPTEVKVELQPN